MSFPKLLTRFYDNFFDYPDRSLSWPFIGFELVSTFGNGLQLGQEGGSYKSMATFILVTDCPYWHGGCNTFCLAMLFCHCRRQIQIISIHQRKMFTSHTGSRLTSELHSLLTIYQISYENYI